MSQGDFSSILAAGMAGTAAARRSGGETAEISARTTALAQMKESQKRAQAAAEAGAVENETQQAFQDKEGDGSLGPGPQKKNRENTENIPPEKDPFGQVGGSLDISV